MPYNPNPLTAAEHLSKKMMYADKAIRIAMNAALGKIEGQRWAMSVDAIAAFQSAYDDLGLNPVYKSHIMAFYIQP